MKMDHRCVLITGATGFIGQALCAKMLECGWEVRALLRKSSVCEALPAGIACSRINSIENGDFNERDFFGVDTIIHLAGRVHVSKSFRMNHIEAFRNVNVLGTERLARMAVRMNVRRFIFISSVKVNGEGAGYAYTEDDNPDPQDAYAVSKREAEDMLKAIAARTGLEIVILRFPLVYGLNAKANFKNLVKIVRTGLPLPLKDAHNLRSFVYLGNVVDAILTCVRHPKAAGETFLVSDGQDISTAELIRMIARAMNKRVVLFFLHPAILKSLSGFIGMRREIEKLTGSLVVNSGKIRRILGWRAPFTVEEGIRHTVSAEYD